MAKGKKTQTKPKKAAKKKAVKAKSKPVKTVKEPAKTNEVVTAAPAKKNNKGIIMGVALLILAVFVVEIYFSMQKMAVMNLKPEIISSWQSKMKSYSAIRVYKNNLYVVENRDNVIQQYEKISGELLHVYEADKGLKPIWVAETSDGTVLVVQEGSPKIIKFQNMKKVGYLELPVVPQKICVTSDDFLVVVSGNHRKLEKYTLDGELVFDYSKTCGEEGQIKSHFGGLFRGYDGDVYVRDNLDFILYNAKGKFVRKFTAKIEQPTPMIWLAPMSNGDCYVNDMQGSSIHVYNKKGKLVTKFDKDKDSTFIITYPALIASALDDQLFVSTHKFAMFKPIQY